MVRKAFAVICLAALAAVGMSSSATAQDAPPTSEITTFALDRCDHTVDDPKIGVSEWMCEGYGDHKVWVAQADQRMLISFGDDARDRCAGRETFISPNTIEGDIEWRLRGGDPFATITRWSTGENGDDGTFLVVTSISAKDVCHVAYIDADLPSAQALSRVVADGQAEGFDCSVDHPVMITKLGKSPDQLAAGFPCSDP
ncbi:hypothetical protein FHS85_002599 [Rhodoligotrophos appendicifer]|uniref:hypothetical protein n=1 Tax=Rhodoligotrophos appendicifer TaxID=987056 RepID=UPI00118529E3|nr:hypothetical protein [Rhodoligotrophos appendicifer]